MRLFTWLYRKRRIKEIALPRGLAGQEGFSSNTLYMLPSHLQEVNRLDFQHYMLRHAFQANYMAPIGSPTRILDVACGTGRWMLEIAQTFPRAEIIGFDLKPPAMESSAVPFPTTCSFVSGNILDGLPFGNQSFDFVHQRFLILALPQQEWPAEVRELVRVTRIGGWVELVEADLDFRNQGPASKRLVTWVKQASEKRGINIAIGRKTMSFLQMAGLSHITEKKLAIPIGNWGGRIGSMLATDLSTGLRSIKPLVTATLQVETDDFDQTLNAWLQECESNHCTYDFNIVYGQRTR